MDVNIFCRWCKFVCRSPFGFEAVLPLCQEFANTWHDKLQRVVAGILFTSGFFMYLCIIFEQHTAAICSSRMMARKRGCAHQLPTSYLWWVIFVILRSLHKSWKWFSTCVEDGVGSTGVTCLATLQHIVKNLPLWAMLENVYPGLGEKNVRRIVPDAHSPALGLKH